nr:hypothetical transcript [Hymenolepis microstoma]
MRRLCYLVRTCQTVAIVTGSDSRLLTVDTLIEFNAMLFCCEVEEFLQRILHISTSNVQKPISQELTPEFRGKARVRECTNRRRVVWERSLKFSNVVFLSNTNSLTQNKYQIPRERDLSSIFGLLR